MNKRQKIVQEQFLNNEEAIIRKLKNLYNHAEKEITQKAQALQDDINRLGALADLATDDEEKAKILSQQQSKIYQKQYQDAMKKQISGILDQMQADEFKTVSDYLNQCYEEGFLGTMYDLQGQGIPLCFPMDQEAIVRAVQLDSKISKGLYSRLGEDVSMLKKKITAQVSRGISTGMSYQQIAQQLAGISRIGYNNAVRIARTEGHRIATQSAMDACYRAKDNGADVVKQWDATLDSSTRESHVQVDMEIRELDKKFSNGLMFPGDPSGGAAEVVNCRCSLDQRARWALEGEFTKWDGFTGELKTFEDQEAYNEYKKAYFSKENKQFMKYVEEMQGKYNSGNFEKVMTKMTDAEYKHFTKLQAARPTFEGMYRDQPYVKKINATKYDDFKAEYMSSANKMAFDESTKNNWDDTIARSLTKAEKRELIQYAADKNIKIVDLKDFDGDPEILKSEINAIKKMADDFPPRKKVVVSISNSMADEDFASTRDEHITFNAKMLRSREITERNIGAGAQFASSCVEDIAIHEYGHIISATKGNKGLEIARKAYYNIYGKNLETDDLIDFLDENISNYSTTFSRNKHGEVTPEILAKNNLKPTDFTKEFFKLLKGDYDEKT